MTSVSKVCAAKNCDDPARAKGFCIFHYKRSWAGVPLDAPRVLRGEKSKKGQQCSIDECSRVVKVWDLCKFHNERRLNGLDLNVPSPKINRASPRESDFPVIDYRHNDRNFSGCLISGCDSSTKVGYVLCNSHMARAKRFSLSALQMQMILDKRYCDSCGEDSLLAESHIDHDHSCCPRLVRRSCGNCTRGILCRTCNLGIGLFGESIEKMQKAVQYLSAIVARTDTVS